MAFSDPLVIGAVSYAGVDRGRYMSVSSTPDQPIYISLFANPNRNPGSNSSYSAKYEIHKNVVVGGATAPEDDSLIVTISIKTRARSFTDAEVRSAISHVTQLFTDATNGASNTSKLLRGER